MRSAYRLSNQLGRNESSLMAQEISEERKEELRQSPVFWPEVRSQLVDLD
jgi:hypothetical protein